MVEALVVLIFGILRNDLKLMDKDYVYFIASYDEKKHHSRDGQSDIVFKHHRRFRWTTEPGEDILHVFVKPVKVDDTDQTAQKDTQSKAGGHEKEAEKKKYPQ